jgi:hypothetical protein
MHFWSDAAGYRLSGNFFLCEAFRGLTAQGAKEPPHSFKMSLEEKLDKIRSPNLQSQQKVNKVYPY